MKICWSIRRALVAYQDGALGHRRAQRIARHLHTCAACRRDLVELQRVTRLLHSLPDPSRAPEYWPSAVLQLRGKLQQLAPHPMRSSWLGYLRAMPESPAQALVPLALVSVALFSTLTHLGLEEEAFAFFSSYLLPIILE
jgi:anti-sigma factor RsiW